MEGMAPTTLTQVVTQQRYPSKSSKVNIVNITLADRVTYSYVLIWRAIIAHDIKYFRTRSDIECMFFNCSSTIRRWGRRCHRIITTSQSVSLDDCSSQN